MPRADESPIIQRDFGILKKTGVWFKADEDEGTTDPQLLFLTSPDILNQQFTQTTATFKPDRLCVEANVNVLLFKEFVLVQGLRRELAPAYKKCDMVSDVGQVQRRLDRAVAAAEDSDMLSLVGGAVTGSTVVDAIAKKVFLARDIQTTLTTAGGDDDGVAAAFLAGRRDDRVIVVVTTYRRDAGGLQNLHAEEFRLLAQTLTELEPRNRLGEPGTLSR